jgi:hypothetical protein
MVEALKKRGRGYAELLGPVAGHRGPLTETLYDEFRRGLRRVAAEDLAAIADPGARRMALDDLLKLQPDSKSKGELFTAYVRIGKSPAGPRHELNVPYEPPFMSGRQQPDDVNFGSDLSKELPPGTFAVDHKAGEGAFKIDQAEGYARAFRAPGGPVTTAGEPAGWDGVVFVFTGPDEAEKAFRKMQRSAIVDPLLGRPQNGIHVLYVDGAGVLRPYTGAGVGP